jgi:tRNA-specific 2-thiouridylase
MPKLTMSISETKQNTSINKKKTVFVGLSGGVDSSVAAHLLKKEGYSVVGAFIKIWQPEFAETCTWKEDRRSAMRVAARLRIPFVTIDLSEEYKKGVIDYMISEYKNGRTPNPDVMCNREIKFKAFLHKAIEMGADLIATGHYARISQKSKVESRKDNSKFENFQLLKAVDEAKEQSYFLWTLGQDELSKALLPIGHLPKKEVRKIAEKAGLHTFEKKDSQGLCFIGKVDFKDFLKEYIEPIKGEMLNTEGKVIGYHDGAAFLTIGERHGFTIVEKSTDDTALYVVDKDINKNTVTVASKVNESLNSNLSNEFILKDTNWISGEPEKNKTYDAQVRYHQEYQKCVIEVLNEYEVKIVFENPQTGAKGQSVVVYDKNICLGGGIIS